MRSEEKEKKKGTTTECDGVIIEQQPSLGRYWLLSRTVVRRRRPAAWPPPTTPCDRRGQKPTNQRSQRPGQLFLQIRNLVRPALKGMLNWVSMGGLGKRPGHGGGRGSVGVRAFSDTMLSRSTNQARQLRRLTTGMHTCTTMHSCVYCLHCFKKVYWT